MKLEMIAVRDRALNAYMRPFFAQTKNQAIRMFIDEINRKESEMHGHPDDYDLYYLGTWEDQTGQFDPNRTDSSTTAELLMLGKNAVRQ